MRRLILVVVVMLAGAANAADWSVQVHLAALHHEQHKYEAFTPGIAAVVEDGRYVASAGHYSNSYGDPSAYVAGGLRLGRWRVQAVVANGYERLNGRDVEVSPLIQYASGKKIVISILPYAIGFGVEF